MKKSTIARLIAAGAILWSASVAMSPAQAATFFINDVKTWFGSPAGPGVNEAVLVIDWADGTVPLVWGYRWESSETKTGTDLLAAVVGAEPRLTLSGLSAGFISDIGWNEDGQGANERFRPGYNATTGEYWGYFVNNNQQAGNFNNGAAPGGAHVLPPLGSPYDGAGPGAWISSNTGIAGRPLVNGSWDGFRYTTFGSPGPAIPVPEPQTLVCLFIGGAVLARRRQRA